MFNAKRLGLEIYTYCSWSYQLVRSAYCLRHATYTTDNQHVSRITEGSLRFLLINLVTRISLAI